jgi:hypothetical protein
VKLEDYVGEISNEEKETINKILLDSENEILEVFKDSMKGCLFDDHTRIYELLVGSI